MSSTVTTQRQCAPYQTWPATRPILWPSPLAATCGGVTAPAHRTHTKQVCMTNCQHQQKRAVKKSNPCVLPQLRVLLRSWTWRRPTAPHTESLSVLPTRPTRITSSLPSDSTTNTLARQQTIPVSSHSCHVVQPMMSWQSPPQKWGEVYQDSVKHWKQV